ncbi:MAG: hypothetical protein IKB04_02000 [Clostridia bacterium]|nr:hypothetical protein [Clostridia bacterium]
MARIEEIDANFKTNTTIGKADVKFYNVQDEPFAVYGVFYENGQYRRLPEEVARATSEGVYELHNHTAGGRVRFRTNSTYVAMHMETPCPGRMAHFAFSGSAGLDLYETIDGKERYIRTFVPPLEEISAYEGVIELGEGMHEITVHFPLYSQVSALYIGVSETAVLEAPTPYIEAAPIVYYGSSITQGGCASRPGNAYQNILTRWLNRDHVNLGFSGSAKGEEVMAEYIAGLNMSLFVYDYDHNAPTVQHLEETHERMFRTIRAAHPTMPIVMMTRPKVYLNEEEKQRLEVVKKTYRTAKLAGDENVYFVPGPSLMEWAENEGTVDNCHPNDLGFMSIAKALYPLLQSIV